MSPLRKILTLVPPSKKAAVARLYMELFVSLRAFAEEVAPTPEDAEDIVQSAFLALLEQSGPPALDAVARRWLRAEIAMQCLALMEPDDPRGPWLRRLRERLERG